MDECRDRVAERIACVQALQIIMGYEFSHISVCILDENRVHDAFSSMIFQEVITPAIEEEKWAADTTHNILFQFVSFEPVADAVSFRSLYLSFQVMYMRWNLCHPSANLL